ncbi:hypothetical protein [Paraburkholderia sp. A1RO-5L]
MPRQSATCAQDAACKSAGSDGKQNVLHRGQRNLGDDEPIHRYFTVNV